MKDMDLCKKRLVRAEKLTSLLADEGYNFIKLLF